jgi:hypothetical protein
MSKGFSCNFLDLTMRQNLKGLSCDIFYKHFQPKFASAEMIKMFHVHSNISMTAKLGVINSQFYRFLRLCSCKKCFVFQMVSFFVLLKVKGYPLKILSIKKLGFHSDLPFVLIFLKLLFTPLDELYSLIDLLIDLDHGLYK